MFYLASIWQCLWKNVFNKKWFSNTCKIENVWKRGILCTSVSSVSPNTSLYVAIDNVDFQIDMPDGKEQLYDTTKVVFQEKDGNCNKNIERFKRNTSKNTENVYNTIYCASRKSRN